MSTNIASIRYDTVRIEKELQRRRWLKAPDEWVRDRLKETIWSGQQRILASVRDHRRTAVKSCHEIGKSFIAGRVAGWWLDIHKPGEAAVLTTAPTGAQVSAILWKEIGRVHTKGNLHGRTNQTNWWLPVKQDNGLEKEELVAFGRKPADMNPGAFQGIHAKYLLVMVDEACGVSGFLWEAIDSLIANDRSKILLLGNPDFPETEFEKACKPGSGYNVVQISAFDTPLFTGEDVPEEVTSQLIGRTYVEEKRKRWAPTWYWVDRDGNRCTPEQGAKCLSPAGTRPEDIAPFWASKVLGEFPVQSGELGLIPAVWIRAAMDRSLAPAEPNQLGVDCGAGGDASCTAHRKGPVVRIISEDHNPNTMETAGKVAEELRVTGAYCAKIDKIGIGAGIVDRGVELGLPFIGINVGEKPTCICAELPPVQKGMHSPNCNVSRFVNFKAQCWWEVRDRFEEGQMDLDPLDEDTVAELTSLRYKRTSSGKIQIESKEEAKRRGIPSPNRAEAVMLAYAEPRDISAPSGGLLW